MGDLGHELRHALRTLGKSPGFTIAAVAALALGIGVNTAVFTVVNAVLLKPLGYPNSDRMVEFGLPSSMIASFLACVPEFHEYQRQTSVFEEVAAYDIAGPGFNLTGDRPEQVHGIHVTESYFRLFGAPVLLGRTFTPQEDAPNGGKVVVLSYGLWQRRFGGDPAIVGKSVSLGNEPYTVVGVLGRRFRSDPEADLWLPFQFPPVSHDLNNFFRVAGRLRPGVTLAEANAQLKVAAAEYHREYPKTSARIRFRVEPLRDAIVGNVRDSLLVLLGAVSLVLLIACANVANLLLARAAGRRREFAIRSALGAGRGRIVRQLLIESLLLAAAGGAIGLLLGFAGMRALLAISPAGLPRIGEGGGAVGVDGQVLGFTLAVSLGTGILFGLFPALGASRTDLNSALKESSNRSGTGLHQRKTRSLLVISEVSLAVVLLIGATLLIRTLMALRDVSPGFDAHHVLTMEMSLTGQRYEKTDGVVQLARNGRVRLNNLPGVEVAAAAYWLPIEVGDALPFEIVGEPADKDHAYGSRWMSVSPGYLSVFRIPVLQGRDFNESDRADSPRVALINERAAREYWPGRNPIGQQIEISKGLGPGLDESGPTAIVGVVADSHNAGLGRPPGPVVMVPIAQVTDAYTASYTNVQPLLWVVRTRGDPHAAIAAVTEQLRIASGGFPVAHVRTMEEVMGSSTARERFNMLLLSIFGVAALLLAAIGIYALMAYSVAQRTQEIGIRMALGADRSAIRRLVIWHGARLTAAGVAVGLGAALALTRLIASFLFAVKPWDPVAFVLATMILAAVALVAVWLPATRASKVDPMEALHAE
ncbi:MAG: ABC transporter permease [Acidobacteriaceae bacterium]